MTDLRAAPLPGCFCCNQSSALHAAPSRRRFMLGAGALALAGALGPGKAMAQTATASQIVFGTDFPYRTGIDHVKGLREAGVFTDEQIAAIERGNAQKLIPRLAG